MAVRFVIAGVCSRDAYTQRVEDVGLEMMRTKLARSLQGFQDKGWDSGRIRRVAVVFDTSAFHVEEII